MQTTVKDIGKILNLQNTINTNLILYGIRRIPIIGNLFNDQIYGIKLFKIFAFIISIQAEIFKAFFGDVCMFIVIFLFSMAVGSAGYQRSDMYLYGFILVSIAGVLLYGVFADTIEADYAVFGLGMDAKRFIIARLSYRLAAQVITYVLLGIPLTILSDVPWFIALLIPFSGVGFQLGGLSLKMWFFSLRERELEKKKIKKDVAFEANSIIMGLVIFVMVMAGIMGMGVLINYETSAYRFIFFAVIILTSISIIPSVNAIKKFPYGYYRIALSGEKVRMTKEKEAQKSTSSITKEKDKINQDVNIDTNLNGYAFLNNIFFKRNKNIINKRLIIQTLIAIGGCGFAALILYSEVFRFAHPERSVIRFLFNKRPWVIIPIMWSLNYTDYICHVMFANCDLVMLKNNYYKTPKALESMYKERLISVIRCNFIPAILVGILSVVSIYVTGGQESPFQYIFNLLLVGIGLVAPSVWHLSIYYLIQPYAINLQIKSKLYVSLNFIILAIMFAFVFAPVPAYAICLVLGILTIIFIYISIGLIKVISPKTFRIR